MKICDKMKINSNKALYDGKKSSTIHFPFYILRMCFFIAQEFIILRFYRKLNIHSIYYPFTYENTVPICIVML